MVSALKSVVLITPSCQLKLRYYLKPRGLIFRWYFSSISWAKFKSYTVVSFISLLLLLVAVAFFTLIERKVLAYIILRRGPNKPAFSGWLVPFADALKLLTKPFLMPSAGSPFLIRFACFLIFIIPSLLWCFVVTASPVWN